MGAVKSSVNKAVSAAKSAAGKASATVKNTHGPSPNPMTNLVIADIALRGGGRLMRHAVERALLGAKYSPETAKNVIRGRSMKQTLIGTFLARTATRSVPGALIVGGGLLAKTLFDRRKDARKAQAEGNSEVAEQAGRGRRKNA